VNIRPPSDHRAEQAVLGALLWRGDCLVEAAGILKPEHFQDDHHRLIYEAALRVSASGGTPDLVLVQREMESEGTLAKAGGAAELSSLVDGLPDTANVAHYANLVRDAARRHELQRIGLDILSQTSGLADHTEDILEDAGRRIAMLGNAAGDSAVEAVDAASLSIVEARAEAEGRGTDPGIMTGFPLLDGALGGMAKGDLVTLGAARSVGKSALALQIATHVAKVQGASVLYVSLEMSRKQLGDRLLAQGTGLSVGRIRHGNLAGAKWLGLGGEWPRVEAVRDSLQKVKLQIVHRGELMPGGIRTLARARQLRKGLDLIIVDYLQLMEPDTRQRGRVEELTAITRGLKRLAMQIEVPVLVLSQINREPDKRLAATKRAVPGRDPSEPTLSDLAWSGSIERDSDSVILLHRKVEGTEDELQTAVAILAKNRQGPTARQPLMFEPKAVRFREGS